MTLSGGMKIDMAGKPLDVLIPLLVDDPLWVMEFSSFKKYNGS